MSNYVYAAGVSLLALTSSSSALASLRPLTWLGQRSYVLYLSHLIFLVPVMRLLKTIPAVWQHQAVAIAIALTVALVAASVFVLMAEKLLPRRLQYYLLGIKPA